MSKLRPIAYWQNKKKQYLAGTTGLGKRLAACGAGFLGLLLLFAVGMYTVKPVRDQVRQIPLKPVNEHNTREGNIGDRLTLDSQQPAEPAAVLQEQQTAQVIRPVDGETVLDFGWQEHPVFKDWRYHPGIDFAVEHNQPVKAALSGEVREVVNHPRTGLTVVIATGQQTAYYGSLASVRVKAKDRVLAGQIIGAAGSFDQEPYPHLHFAIQKEGEFIHPAELLPSR